MNPENKQFDTAEEIFAKADPRDATMLLTLLVGRRAFQIQQSVLTLSDLGCKIEVMDSLEQADHIFNKNKLESTMQRFLVLLLTKQQMLLRSLEFQIDKKIKEDTKSGKYKPPLVYMRDEDGNFEVLDVKKMHY